MLCILIVVFIRLNRSPLARAVVYPVGFRTGLPIHSFDKFGKPCVLILRIVPDRVIRALPFRNFSLSSFW